MASREELLGALRRADAAGDAEGARRIAAMIRDVPAQPNIADALVRSAQGIAPEAKRIATARAARRPFRMGARAALEGFGNATGLVDVLTGGNIASSITGAPTQGQLATASANWMSDKAGLPTPQTPGQNQAYAITRGVASAIPTMALGGPFAEAPVAQLLAGGAGGLSGEVAKQNGAGAVGQMLATLAGGIGGFAGARALSRAPRVSVPSPTMAAADRQGITLLPADVGGTGTRFATGIIRGGTIGEIPIQQAAENSVNSAYNATRRVAGNIGAIAEDTTAAGQAAQRGARSFIKSSEHVGGKLYDAIPIKPTQQAATTNTVETLRAVTSGLQSNPLLSEVWAKNPRLQATLSALTPQTKQVPTGMLDAQGNPLMREVTHGGTVSWADMKELRTIIGKTVGQPSLTSEGPERDALRAIYGALSRDMEETARQQGPKALQAFTRATQYWRGRQDRIDNVLSGILGEDGQMSSDAAYRQINSWAQQGAGNSRALARALRSMPEDEAGTIRATVLARLGRSPSGQQGAEGNTFSPATFVINWDKLSPRAKSSLFPNAQHRADINDLAMVMADMKRAGAYANTSKTGLVVGGGQVLGAILHPVAGVPIIAGEFGLGKLLSSPRVARWLATSKVPQTAGQQKVMWNTIRNLSAANPELKDTLTAIGNAANDNMASRLAADPEEQRKGSQ